MFNNSCYVLADGECVSPLPCAHGDPMGVDEFVVKVESAGCASDAFRWITAKALSAWTAAPLSTLPERPGAEFISHCADHEEAIGALSDALGLTDWDSPSDVITAFRARLSSLERELDGVRKDAERMDFLERGGFTAFQSSEHKSANVVDCRDNFTKGEGRFYAETIREAIDAAMAYDASLSALRERSE